MTNSVGDTLEMSLWFNAEKPGELAAAEKGLYKSLVLVEQQNFLETGPVTFETMSIGDDRVPEPPPSFQGTPKVLVATCVVIKIIPQLGDEPGFTQDLDNDDLVRLRKVTQNAYLISQPPGTPLLSDTALDHIIDKYGPDTAVRSLASDVDERSIH
jgi:hypothetical protein